MRMKCLLLGLCLAVGMSAAGSVSSSCALLGNGPLWVATFSWIGDASGGSVPATAGTCLGQFVLQGNTVTAVKVVPGSPAPTSGYALTLKDSNGLDFGGGLITSLSSSAAQQFTITAPPLNGALTLAVTGNSVNSAQGTVYVYLSPGNYARRGGGGSGTGLVQVQVDSANIGSPRATVNLLPGTCVLLPASDTGSAINVQVALDTAVCPSKASLQSGVANTLTETSASASTYTFTMSPTLTAYPSGVGQLPVWSWKVGTTASGGAITGNVDTLGAKSIVEPDGTNPTAAHLTAGQKVLLTYDSVAGKLVIMGGEAAAAATSRYLFPPQGPATGTSTGASPCGGGEPCATDTLIADSGALAALAAGTCIEVHLRFAVSNASGGINTIIWIGATARSGATIYFYSSTQVGPFQVVATICNLAGSQTTQTADGIQLSAAPSINGAATAGLTQTLSSAFHISVSSATNNGSGVTSTFTPRLFTGELVSN